MGSKQEFVKLCATQEEGEIRTAFLRILSSIKEDTLDAVTDLVVSALHSEQGPPRHASIVHAFVDSLWLYVTQGRTVAASPGQTQLKTSGDGSLLILLTRKVIDQDKKQDKVLLRALVESLDSEFLESVGAIPSEADLQKKLRLTNTQLFYKQTKFNLMAEESEGFSKFLHTLSTSNDEDVSERVESIIGTFHLDPNRCLDLTFDVLELEFLGECEPANKAQMWKLLRLMQTSLKTDKLPALLGFKLTAGGRDDVRPLLRCMSWLAVHDPELMSVRDMLEYLPPYQTLLEQAYKATMETERDRVRDMGRIRLSSDTESDTAAGRATSVDLSALRADLVIQWVDVFLRQKAWNLIEADFDQDWSRLCVVFPETVGLAICDWVQDRVEGWLRQKGATTPWTASADGIAPAEAFSSSVRNVLLQISLPLSYTFEAGAILLRPDLYTLICRLLHVLLTETDDRPDELIAFVRTFLLPTLSQFPPNPVLSAELWKILNVLPYRTRYDLYRHWRGSGLERAALSSDKPLWLVEGELMAGKEARYHLKRLSKDTIRDTSRAIAKVCHNHPLVIFSTILNQIESYDNLVDVIVDCLRFVTPLSLDVLGYCILSRLIGSAGDRVNRSRLKDDGVTVSQWLQSLETFAGAFYRRFPTIDFQGILCYLQNQLKEGHVMELGVLRTLLKQSAGWAFADYSPAASLSATQLEGRAGSTQLIRETMSFGVVEEINRRASMSVRRVLHGDDMGVSLLILLAQVRFQIIFGSESERPKPVKLIGNLHDACQVTMAILLDFLTGRVDDASVDDSTIDTEILRYAKSIPPLMELFRSYRLDVASSWMICRPLSRAARDTETNKKGHPLAAFKSSELTRKSYEAMLPPSCWQFMSTEIFEVFYTCNLYDLSCPEECYITEIARLDKELERLSKTKETPQDTSLQSGLPASNKDETASERVKAVAAALSSDLAKHKKHVSELRISLEEKKIHFFVSDTASKAAALTFLSHCVFPRCIQGPDDAMMCARFVFLLHDMETPGFSTMHLVDSMVVTLASSLFGLTEGEAASVAILLSETWKVVSKWRYDRNTFDDEVSGKPGSYLTSQCDDGVEAHPVSSEEYETLYNKWHAAIGAACLGCLKSSQYIHIRCCIIVLTRMVDIFPTKPSLGNRLLDALEPLQDESYAFADIRAAAQAYGQQLRKARELGVWKEEDAETVRARQAKEQAAAAERQKKAEEQMEEMKRESEKITEEIGDSFRRGGGGRPENRRPAFEPPPRLQDESRRETDNRRDERWRAEERRGGPPPARDATATREPPNPREAPPPARGEDRWPRDRGSSGASSASAPPATRSPPPREEGPLPRGLEGRWQGAGRENAQGRSVRATSTNPAGGSKRSRPSSPVEQGETREGQQASKRARTGDLEPGEEDPRGAEETATTGGRRAAGRNRRGRQDRR